MLPDGWQFEKLGALFDFKNGVNTEAANYGSGLKFVNVMDVFNNHSLTCEKIRERVNIPEKKSDIYLLEYGDILFNRTSETYDEIGLSTVYLDSKPAIFGGFVIRARQTTNKLDPDYCVYSFLSREVRKEIIRRGQGAIRTNIGQGDMRKVPLLIPPLPEQKKIAKTLSTWDKAITTTEQLIANSQQQKKALMQQLLTGKKRLAGFSGEWKYAQFLQLFRIANDKKTQVKSTEYLETGVVPVVDQGKKLIAGYTNNSTVYDDTPVIIFGDHTRIVKWVDFTFASGADGTQILKTTSELDMRFGFFSLLNTDIPNLGYSRHMRELKEKDFKYPVDKIEQQKIAQVLSSADQEIETLQQKLNFLKEEKKALMQQLLTGKRRVNIN